MIVFNPFRIDFDLGKGQTVTYIIDQTKLPNQSWDFFNPNLPYNIPQAYFYDSHNNINIPFFDSELDHSLIARTVRNLNLHIDRKSASVVGFNKDFAPRRFIHTAKPAAKFSNDQIITADIQTLFHMSLWGTNHARLPYNHLTSGDDYPDKLAAILGRAEISFTFTLTDNITYRSYNAEDGAASSVLEGTTADLGQERGDGWIPLIDEIAHPRPGFVGSKEKYNDPRVQWDGYGYIIEGFNVKCVGKVPYTITFYSPQGYLYADPDGELKEGDKEWRHPYNRTGYAVWRGKYLSQALYSDDTRLWNNTKNLAKPHRAHLPYRYPRACLPVPPVNLKDPTKWGKYGEVKVKTNWVNKYVGDIFNCQPPPPCIGDSPEAVNWGVFVGSTLNS